MNNKKNQKTNSTNTRLTREEIQQLATGLIETLAQSKSSTFTIRQLYKKLGLSTQEEKEKLRMLTDVSDSDEDTNYTKNTSDTSEQQPKKDSNSSNNNSRKEAKSEPKEEDNLPEAAEPRLDHNEYIGVVDNVMRDYAYIVCENLEQDAFVNTRKLKGAINGDKVKVRVNGKQKGKNPEGEVVEIIERGRTEFVGKVEMLNRFAFVIVENRKLKIDIFVPLSKLNEAKNNDKVVVKVIEWAEEKDKNPVGEVIEVLGKSGENEAEINAIMVEFGLPTDFDKKLIQKAKEIKDEITDEEIQKRKDFRPVLTFTIDPHDAKDFDDAISLQQLPNGNYEIGVHIADVTHYVHTKSLLEQEAQKRATSVYLVDRVVPMLPERLSNQLCSLRPQEEKLTFSAVFELDQNANIRNRWYGKTIIYSDRRFTYEEAQERIENGEGDYADEIILLNKIAKKLQQKRFNSGAISFETQEVKFKLDENGKPLGVIPKVRKDAHKLVEEYMLLANKSVAEFVYKFRNGKDKNTMVYRVHEEPDPEKLSNLKQMAKNFGYDIDINPEQIPESLKRLAELTEGKPENEILQSLAIRSMSKAYYTTKPLGHFGLAFEHYSHFTSPIRRYPDMMAHRLLEKYLKKNVKSIDPSHFDNLCKHSSEMEKRAADAERASIRYKQAEFMQERIGEVFEGLVSGVTEWGLYVEITETACEGMIRLSDIEGDYFEYEPKNQWVIGRRTEQTFTIGNQVRVIVKAVDLDRRTIDLLMDEGMVEQAPKNRHKKRKGKPSKRKKR